MGPQGITYVDPADEPSRTLAGCFSIIYHDSDPNARKHERAASAVTMDELMRIDGGYTFAECDFSANVVNARRRFGEIRYSQRAMARRMIR